MNKILLIIRREYLTRVRKRSFVVMTILGPLLIAAMYAGIIWLALNSDSLNEIKKVMVIDESNVFEGKFENSKVLEFNYTQRKLEEAKQDFKKLKSDYLLYIPPFSRDTPSGIQLYAEKQPGVSIVNSISSQLAGVVEDNKLIAAGIDKKILENLKTEVNINTIRLTETGEETGSSNAAYGIGFLSSLLIYIFIFIFGVQVMRGVIEEKTSRIVEVIISSVKPFQLMMGKIIGIALVGLTQFMLWIVLTAAISGLVTSTLVSGDPSFDPAQMEQFSSAADQMPVQTGNLNNSQIRDVLEAVDTINFPLIIGCFIFYFLGGYLLYSALFAAIGSAVDSEAETQQFMFPVTIPLIFAFVVSTSVVINAPDSSLSFWISVIPLTSPVAMMVRIPFGVPVWELLVSMASLVAGFFIVVWLASKIYRTGILMYGKKVSFKEIGKWLLYKA